MAYKAYYEWGWDHGEMCEVVKRWLAGKGRKNVATEHRDTLLKQRRYDIVDLDRREAFEVETKADWWPIVSKLLTAKRASIPPERLWFALPSFAAGARDFEGSLELINHILVKRRGWSGYEVLCAQAGDHRTLLKKLRLAARLVKRIPPGGKRLATLRDQLQEQTGLPRPLVRWLTFKKIGGRFLELVRL